MKLLLDANVSWRLSDKLKHRFENCFQVDRIGLRIPANENDIWKYAKANELISRKVASL